MHFSMSPCLENVSNCSASLENKKRTKLRFTSLYNHKVFMSKTHSKLWLAEFMPASISSCQTQIQFDRPIFLNNIEHV